MIRDSKQSEILTCAATGEPLIKEDAIKLVLSPQGGIVADLDDVLPGDAVWVACSEACTQMLADTAKLKSLFGVSVEVDVQFAEKLAARMRKQLLQWLALSKKAGQLTVGGQKVKQVLNQGKVRLIFQSRGGSSRELSKLVQGEYKNITVCDLFESDELAGILGQSHIGYLALLKGKMADKIVGRINMLEKWLILIAKEAT